MKTFLSLLFFISLVAEAKLNVCVTTPDLATIVREIGAEQVDVTVFARPTEDPHFIDAKPSFLVKLNKADVLVEGGAGLESAWLGSLLAGTRNQKIQPGRPGHISANAGIEMLGIPAKLDRSHGDIHAEGNPHFLLDPLHAAKVAQTIADRFAQLDPGQAEDYRSRARSFSKTTEEKLATWQKQLEAHRGKRVVTYHDSWPYFAARFGLRMDLFLEPKPGIPPSSRHLADVVKTMKAEKITVILVDPYLSRRTADSAATLAGAKAIPVPPLQWDKQTYHEWMGRVVDDLVKGWGDGGRP